MQTLTLFEGSDIKLTKITGTSNIAVVTFNPFTETKHPTKSTEYEVGYGSGIFEDHGFHEYHIVTNKNDWFQTAEMLRVVDIIKDDFNGTKIITYGSSMGAFGAINYSWLLDSIFVALSPQYSINPLEVDGDRRWEHENNAISFDYNLIKEGKCKESIGFIFYDPMSDDDIHVRKIQSLSNANLIPLPFTDHNVADVINEVYGIKKVITEIANDQFNVNTFEDSFESKKRKSSAYCIKAAKYHITSGNKDEGVDYLSYLGDNKKWTTNFELVKKYVDCMIAMDNKEEAIKTLNEFKLCLDKNVFDKKYQELSYNLLSNEYKELSLYEEAENVIKKAMEYAPSNASYHYKLSVILFNKGFLEQSIEAVKSAIELDNKNPDYHCYYGELLSLNHELDHSEIEYRLAINLHYKPPFYYFTQYSKTLIKKGNIPSAIEILDKALTQYSHEPEIHYLLGECYSLREAK